MNQQNWVDVGFVMVWVSKTSVAFHLKFKKNGGRGMRWKWVLGSLKNEVEIALRLKFLNGYSLHPKIDHVGLFLIKSIGSGLRVKFFISCLQIFLFSKSLFESTLYSIKLIEIQTVSKFHPWKFESLSKEIYSFETEFLKLFRFLAS